MAWFKREKKVPSNPALPQAPDSPTVADLTDAEHVWIAGHLAALSEAGVDDIDSLGRLYDKQLDAWSSLNTAARPDPNEMINRLGVGFGEFVRRQSETRWVIATDQYGSDLALHGEPGDILIFPANMIAKRWTSGELGALPTLASTTATSIAEVRRRADA